MAHLTHIARFIAAEDGREHLGQLIDTTRDIGMDITNGIPVRAFKINGSIFGEKVTSLVLTIDRLLSPVSKDECNYIRCLGLNYVDHANETGMALPEAPILFSKPRTCLSDPYPAVTPIPKCAQDGTSDYEAELAVIIGRTGRDIPEKEALDYVLGYTASNDVSARTLQMTTSQWGFSKGLDGSLPIGPLLVTPHAIPDPQNLAIKAHLNGQNVQDGSTRDMIFSVSQTISYLSQGTTLEAGTIIITGTPAGVGFTKKPPLSLQNGDDIRVQIDKIGTLVNKVHFESY